MSTQQIATAANDPKAGMAEFTLRAVVVGAILGLVFGASSLYLVLKVGLTVSASIPVAVLAITLFRILGATGLVKRTTILENNILQTTGSAGERKVAPCWRDVPSPLDTNLLARERAF